MLLHVLKIARFYVCFRQSWTCLRGRTTDETNGKNDRNVDKFPRSSVDLFPSTNRGADIKMNVLSHVETQYAYYPNSPKLRIISV